MPPGRTCARACPTRCATSRLGANGTLVNAASNAQLSAVLARKATRVEKLFANVAGGNGGTAVAAATMVLEGTIGFVDIGQARGA
jgi:hypothetical protein